MNTRSVNIKTILKFNKLKSNFYLSKGIIYKNLIKQKQHVELSFLCESLSNIGINKRYYVEDKKYGVPFVSNSDLGSTSPLSFCKYVSKNLCYNPERSIKKGMSLVSAIGTIGLTAFAGVEIEGAMTPIGNLIRVNPKKYPGFIYAYLSSRIGQSLILQLGSGSVQTYLDPSTFGKIPIPIFTNSLTEKINNLIEDSSELRTKSYNIINDLGNEFISYLNIDQELYKRITHPRESETVKSFSVPINELDKLSIRSRGYSERTKLIKKVFESQKNSLLIDVLENEPEKGGRYKRVEVSSTSINAIELLNQGDIHALNPEGKMISKKYIDNVEKQTSKKNMILIPAVGTLGESEIFGRPVFVSGYLENKVLSEHLLRITPNPQEIHPGYLFVVLNSGLFFRILRSIVYGTNLLYFIVPFLNKIPIPRFELYIENKIGEKVIQAYDYLSIALRKENQAIELIEKEIDSWQ